MAHADPDYCRFGLRMVLKRLGAFRRKVRGLPGPDAEAVHRARVASRRRRA